MAEPKLPGQIPDGVPVEVELAIRRQLLKGIGGKPGPRKQPRRNPTPNVLAGRAEEGRAPREAANGRRRGSRRTKASRGPPSPDDPDPEPDDHVVLRARKAAA